MTPESLRRSLPPCPELPNALLAHAWRLHLVPRRHYHSFGHVLEVAQRWAEVDDEGLWRKPTEALVAALFHDAVYRVGRNDNEKRSAEEARLALERWPPEADVNAQNVAQMIELTAQHGALKGEQLLPDEALFLDCDMAILGASEERYADYEAAIEREYCTQMPSTLYRWGRKRFLKKLLDSPGIFHSRYFAGRFEAQARDNLAYALEQLGD